MAHFLSGDIFLYPTDTLYGLGVNATDAEAVRLLQTLKGRPDGKPISVMVSDMRMMEAYAVVTPLARRLAEKFLPGALTLVLSTTNLREEITAGTGTVGLRIPAHEAALSLVRSLGYPLTATSANVAGMNPERSVPKILAQFGERASMITQIIDYGELRESRASTVIDARGETPVILREGALSSEEIFSVL